MTDSLLVDPREAPEALDEEAALSGTDIEDFMDPYGPVSWGGQRNAAAPPTTTEEVPTLVRLANQRGADLWPAQHQVAEFALLWKA